MHHLLPHQKVNHFPGSGFITNKVDLATSGLKYIPPAFKLPGEKGGLLEYAERNANRSFVEKDNNHRRIKIRRLEEVDLDAEGSFVQEFVDRPLLVSGYKFDVGIYVVVTSVDPLRVYIYNGEALLRYVQNFLIYVIFLGFSSAKQNIFILYYSLFTSQPISDFAP